MGSGSIATYARAHAHTHPQGACPAGPRWVRRGGRWGRNAPGKRFKGPHGAIGGEMGKIWGKGGNRAQRGVCGPPGGMEGEWGAPLEGIGIGEGPPWGRPGPWEAEPAPWASPPHAHMRGHACIYSHMRRPRRMPAVPMPPQGRDGEGETAWGMPQSGPKGPLGDHVGAYGRGREGHDAPMRRLKGSYGSIGEEEAYFMVRRERRAQRGLYALCGRNGERGAWKKKRPPSADAWKKRGHGKEKKRGVLGKKDGWRKRDGDGTLSWDGTPGCGGREGAPPRVQGAGWGPAARFAMRLWSPCGRFEAWGVRPRPSEHTPGGYIPFPFRGDPIDPDPPRAASSLRAPSGKGRDRDPSPSRMRGVMRSHRTSAKHNGIHACSSRFSRSFR